MTYARTKLPTPVGELMLIASDAGLCMVLWEGETGIRVPVPAEIRDDPEQPVLSAAVAQLEEYFDGDRQDFELPLDVHGTPFQQKVWEILRAIPYGTTISYGEQARRLGDVHKARAVGAANGKNPVSIIVPCHRVIGANGSLTGFAAGLEAKDWLLRHESRRQAPTLFDGAPPV
jgi:methylated-DNA-[protein]-cysteine S-methyltransferase